jgi:hypothetical protein
LGSGAFAEVYIGKLVGDAAIKRVYKDALMLSNFHDCEVAVKTLPPFADEWSKNDFQQVGICLESLKCNRSKKFAFFISVRISVKFLND